jgi:hypothetical protein
MHAASGKGRVCLREIDRSNFHATDRGRETGVFEDAERERDSTSTQCGFDGGQSQVTGDQDGGDVA